ncbi:MAG: ABC transporter ATP-binding protein/permease [Flavobacteriaceae bacterium]|nr:ABC transporter ATP-binding protein/permease [Flavobacteriaceae bacterium]
MSAKEYSNRQTTVGQTLSRLLKLGMKHPFWFYSTLVVAVCLASITAYRPVLVGRAIDRDIIQNKDYFGLFHSILLIFLMLIGEIFFQFLLVYASNHLAQNVIRNLRIRLYKKLVYFKSAFFDRTPIGVLVTRSVSDIETISTIFTDGILMMFGDILCVIFVLVAMYQTNIPLTAITVCIFPVMILVTRIFQKSIKRAFGEERTQMANQNSFVQERLSGMYIVQLFNRQEKEYRNFFKINEKLEKAYLKTVLYFSLFFPVVDVIVGVITGVIIFYVGYGVFHKYNISPGVVIIFITYYINMLVRPMRQIADRFNNIQQGIVGSERVFSMLDSHHELPDRGKIEKKSVEGNIKFEHVYFSYIQEEEVLKDLSFEVSKGEKVAIVGATGAGKSTIINLLSRFYDISGGHIYVDRTDIKDFTLKNLRSHIAVVLQEVFLFNDTILENITLGNNKITYEQIRNAAKEIQIDDFIMSLPNGYHYEVSERGASISLGQRQLISFLRAYLYNPSILVLDEATSSIDTHSEALLQKATEKLTHGRTSIIIAHRLSTIQNADKIIVLDHGRIVEMGTHKTLLAQNGYYRKLYEVQFSTLENKIEYH